MSEVTSDESSSDSEIFDQRNLKLSPPLSWSCCFASCVSILGVVLNVFCASHIYENDWKPVVGIFIADHLLIVGLAFASSASRPRNVYCSHVSLIASLGGMSGILIVACCASHIQGGHWNWTAIAGISLGVYAMVIGLFFQLEGHEISTTLMTEMSSEELQDYVKALQEAKPVITFKTRSYHFKTETRQILVGEDEHGMDLFEDRTRATSEKEYTHSAEMVYPIQWFTDETLSPYQAFALCHVLNKTATIDVGSAGPKLTFDSSGPHPILAVCQFDLKFLPREEQTERHFKQSRQSFFARNKSDHYQETSTEFSLVLDGATYKDSALSTLSVEDVAAGKNWWIHRKILRCCACLCLGPCYQAFVLSTVTTLRWDVLKHFSRLEPASWTSPPVSSLAHTDTLAAVMHALPSESYHSLEPEEVP